MSLPEFVLVHTLKTTDSLIVGNRFYTLTVKERKDNFLFWRGKHIGIEESEKVSDLEKDYFRIYKNEIVSHINSIIEQEDCNLSDILEGSKKNIFDMIRNSNYLEYLVSEFIPKYKQSLKSNADYLDKYLRSTQESDGRCESNETEPCTISRIEKEDDFYIGLLSKEASVMSKFILKNSNFLFLGGDCYKLDKHQGEKGGIYVKVGSNVYLPSLASNLKIEDFDKEFIKHLESRIRNMIFDKEEGLLEKMNKVREQERSRQAINPDYFYDPESNIGFMNKGGQYYIISKVPCFCFYEPHNKKYYVFPECSVGVNILKEDDNFKYGWPVVIDRYSHPGLQKFNEAFQDICLGGYKARFLSLHDSLKKQPDKVTNHLIEIIKASQRLIHRGYFGQGGVWKPMHEHPEAYKEVSKEEAMQIGVSNLR